MLGCTLRFDLVNRQVCLAVQDGKMTTVCVTFDIFLVRLSLLLLAVVVCCCCCRRCHHRCSLQLRGRAAASRTLAVEKLHSGDCKTVLASAVGRGQRVECNHSAASICWNDQHWFWIRVSRLFRQRGCVALHSRCLASQRVTAAQKYGRD